MMNLLSQLYGIHSPTGNEWDMICFVKEYLKEHVPEAEVKLDGQGNLYITKGTPEGGYPTLACHLDQVQVQHSKDFEVVQEGDTVYGWSAFRQSREGLGADDKNGIWICLQCLDHCPRLKVFMAVGEEKGCIGSNRAEMGFFSDSLYVLEPDCKGGEEAHTMLRGIPCASEEFVEALALPEHGYSLTEGKTSDILALTLNDIGVSCINLPAGYHKPHTDDEYTVIGEMEHCLDFVRDTLHRLNRRFPHRYLSETQKRIQLTSKQCRIMDVTNKKCVIRCARAGVFFGIVTHKESTVAGVECTIKDCRRIWSWDGAATLSQMAVDGVSKPEECKFTVVVPEMTVMDVIEIIPATDKAIKSLESVPVWKV